MAHTFVVFCRRRYGCGWLCFGGSLSGSRGGGCGIEVAFGAWAMPICLPVHLTIALFGHVGTRLFLIWSCSDLCLVRRRRWSCRGGGLFARWALRVVKRENRHDGSVGEASSGLGGLACGSIDVRHNYGRSYRKRDCSDGEW